MALRRLSTHYPQLCILEIDLNFPPRSSPSASCPITKGTQRKIVARRHTASDTLKRCVKRTFIEFSCAVCKRFIDNLAVQVHVRVRPLRPG